jgi:hypothetical protein
MKLTLPGGVANRATRQLVRRPKVFVFLLAIREFPD